jgi:hypothetical protein
MIATRMVRASNNLDLLGFHGNDLECGIGVPGNPTSYPGDTHCDF